MKAAVLFPLCVSALVCLPAVASGQSAGAARAPGRPVLESPVQARPRVGVAFGGGSARGIAHVGVIRWFEEHRIPIDLVAGTSMGGLIGGSFAIGMDSHEIEAMLAAVDWDTMFGASSFQFKNVRRKRDGRDFPSALEFGLKNGFSAPTALNSGQQVDLLLSRLAAPYYAMTSFDELPTPLRVVAVDLITARSVVLGSGSLAQAMRATMSMPAVFPPVEAGGQVLVDGGLLNNIPVDVARAMGAGRVVAVNVGDLDDLEEVDYSLFGLIGETMDAMMRATSVKAIAQADLVINVPLEDYGSLDWRRSAELILEGYRAAEAMRADLLPLSVDEAEWQRWRQARAAARRTSLPSPGVVAVSGAGPSDAAMMQARLSAHTGARIDVPTLEADLTALGGLDRYESLIWTAVPNGDGAALHVEAVAKRYGPPFVFVGVSLENTTANDFRFALSGRYLAYDILGSGSETRLDATIGSDPAVAAAWFRPIGRSAFFIEPEAGVRSRTFSVIDDDRIVASYRRVSSWLGGDVGVDLSRLDDLRLGVRYGRLDATPRVGDPGLPELSGAESLADLRWTHDGQDSPVVPTRGLHVRTAVRYFLDAPPPPAEATTTRATKDVTQAEGWMTHFVPVGERREGRLFFIGAAGTSFDGAPLPTEQFSLGGPFRLGAFAVGEQIGDHFVLVSGGYLREVHRLPDFLGRGVYLGGWIESGKAFDTWSATGYAVQGSAGLVVDTLIGPLFLSTSVGESGDWRTYIGIGRIFR